MGNQFGGCGFAVGLIAFEFFLTEGLGIGIETDENRFAAFEGGHDLGHHIGKGEDGVGGDAVFCAHDGGRVAIAGRIEGPEKKRIAIDDD